MKKLILATLVLFSSFSFAQLDKRNSKDKRFGVTAGLNYSRVRFAHNPSGPIYSFQAGLLGLFPLSDDDQFYLQPEIEYYGAGETGKDKNAVGLAGYNAVYGNHYISVPIYFKGFFSEAESEFFAMGGPRFNFLIGQKLKNVANEQYTLEGSPSYPGVNGKASGFAFALGLGIGYSYKRQLELALKYDMGFSNVYKNLVEKGTNDPNVSKRKTEHVLSIGLSYIFE